MTTTTSVLISTYGAADPWALLAGRAAASAYNQTTRAHEVLLLHDQSLHESRNHNADRAAGEWLVFLDADDELDFQYLDAMAGAVEQWGNGDNLFRPNTVGVRDGVIEGEPCMIPRRDMERANCCVIGTMCRRDRFLAVGGFRDLPALEDWDLWRRMCRAGSSIVDVPDAIYRVDLHSGGRNGDSLEHRRAYQMIRSGR